MLLILIPRNQRHIKIAYVNYLPTFFPFKLSFTNSLRFSCLKKFSFIRLIRHPHFLHLQLPINLRHRISEHFRNPSSRITHPCTLWPYLFVNLLLPQNIVIGARRNNNGRVSDVFDAHASLIFVDVFPFVKEARTHRILCSIVGLRIRHSLGVLQLFGGLT